MEDFEFRAFSPGLVSHIKKITRCKIKKLDLLKLNSVDFHNIIFKKNNIKSIKLLSIPFPSIQDHFSNYEYLINHKKHIKIKSDLILPINIDANFYLSQYNYIVKNLKHIDGIEFLLNMPSHNNNEDQIVYFIKKILKKKQLKIFFFPASSIRIRNKLSMLNVTNIINRINQFNNYKNNFFVELSGGGIDFYLDNGKFSKIFRNVNIVFDTHLNTKFKAVELLNKLGKKRVKFGSDFPFINNKNINIIYSTYKKLF